MDTEQSKDYNVFTFITSALIYHTGFCRDISQDDLCSLNKNCIGHKGDLLTNVYKLVF